MKRWFRRLRAEFAKKDLYVFAASIVFAAVYTSIDFAPEFLRNLTNFLFLMGIFYVIAGLCVHVKNAGLFKAFSYTAYKRRFRRYGNADPRAQPLSLAEYNIEMQNRRSSIKEYFIIGLPLVAISFFLVFIT